MRHDIFTRLKIGRNFDVVNDVTLSIRVTPSFLSAWEKRVGPPHGALGKSSHIRLESFELCPEPGGSIMIVLHPLIITDKLQWGLLEAFLGDLAYSPLGHLAESVGVPTSMVGADVPLHLSL